jgi:hypothetical protein
VSSPWIHTRSGTALDLRDPQEYQIRVADIAHALGRLCRYTGHASAHYSVAEHCVLGARQVLAETRDMALAWAFLVHDAHEAYVGDVAAPLKRALRGTSSGLSAYDELEFRIARAVRMKLRAPITMPEAVATADLRMLMTEAPQLLSWPPPRDWRVTAEPYPDLRLECWPAERATTEWLACAWTLAPELRVRTEVRAAMERAT